MSQKYERASVLENEFGYILSVKKLGKANAYPVCFQNETHTPDRVLPEDVKGCVLRKFALSLSTCDTI